MVSNGQLSEFLCVRCMGDCQKVKELESGDRPVALICIAIRRKGNARIKTGFNKFRTRDPVIREIVSGLHGLTPTLAFFFPPRQKTYSSDARKLSQRDYPAVHN